MPHLEFQFRRVDASYVFESSDGRVSIAGLTIDSVLGHATRLIREFVDSGTSCRVQAYISLGSKARLLRDCGAICKVNLRDANKSQHQLPSARQRWQMPGDPVPDPPVPVFSSWDDYLQRTSYKERMARCHAAAMKANRKRLLSETPKVKLRREDVWAVIEAARGRCAHCGSLAVESRPSSPNGAPIAWAQIGRRIGSLEHVSSRYGGGDNDQSNLAWACLWCNTWPSERRPHAADHGGFYPAE